LAIQCIRRLRIHAVSKNSESIFIKARMRNWLAICARLRRIDQGMPHFYEIKLKYKSLNKWIWLLRRRYHYMTKGLVRKVDRRKDLLARFSQYLDKRVARDEHIMSQDALYAQLNREVRPGFLRWVEFTQLAIAHHTIIRHCDERRRLRILRRAFTGMSLSVKAPYTLQLRRSANKFTQRRVHTDLEVWRRRLVVGTQRLTSVWTRRRNAYVRAKMRKHAIQGDSFKKLDREWTEAANMRIRLEQRLLFLEFQKRGQCPYEDVYLPQLADLRGSEAEAGSSLLHSEHSQGLNAKHEDRYTDGPLPEESVLRTVTVYVDGWIVGIESSVTWRVIEEGISSSPQKKRSLSAAGMHHNNDPAASLTTTRGQQDAEPMGTNGGKLRYRTERRSTLHGKKADRALTFDLDKEEERKDVSGAPGEEGANDANKKKNRKQKKKKKKNKKKKKSSEADASSAGGTMGRQRARDQIVAIEGFAADVVGRVRFICSSGRMSPWYGQVAVGEHFIYMGDSKRTPDNCEVVGFHGLADHDGLKTINPIMRYTLDAPLFSNCWTEHAGREKLKAEAKRQKLLSSDGFVEEDEDDRGVGFEDIADSANGSSTSSSKTGNKNKNKKKKKKPSGAPTGDESQFAAMLRMRSVDIRQALSRAQKLVRRIRRNPNTPAKLQPLKIAMAIGHWYFEALCRSLVKLKGSDVDEGERLLEQGERIVRRGQNLVNHGKHILSKIDEYRPDGNHELRPAVTGHAYVKKVRGEISEAEAIVKQGRYVRDQGRTLVERGFSIMPHMPRNRSLKRYFESLAELAKVRDMLGPEAFEVAPVTPRMGDDDEEEHASSLGDSAEARAGILAAKGGEALAKGGMGI
jgi:hypothetical protein